MGGFVGFGCFELVVGVDLDVYGGGFGCYVVFIGYM